MKIKTKYLKLNNSILGESDVYLLLRAEPYKRYDPIARRTTDEIEGYRFKIGIDDPDREIDSEKLEVKIVGANPIPQYKSGERVFCKFVNLQLTISTVEFGNAEIKATADGIKLVDTKTQAEQPISGQIKLKL